MGGAGFAVIKYDRVVFQAVHSRGELNWRASAEQCKNVSEYDRRNFPAAKAIRAPTPLLR